MLASLRETLQEEHVAVITGERGIGKSTLARAYCQHYAQEYAMVVWLDASSLETFFSSYLTQSKNLVSSLPSDFTQADLIKLAQEWTGKVENMLLVIDSVVFPKNSVPTSSSLQIKGHVILIAQSIEQQPDPTCVFVESLDASDGAALLSQMASQLATGTAPMPYGEKQRQIAAELSQAMGGAPLALDVVAHYLVATKTDLQDYLVALQHKNSSLPVYGDAKNVLSALVANGDNTGPAFSSLELACHLTLTHLRQTRPHALTLLQAYALLAPETIPTGLHTELYRFLHTEPAQLAETDHDLARDALHTLLAFGLLTPRTLFSGLRMHPLIQQIVSAMLDQEQQKDLAQAILSACTRLQSTTNDFMQQICLASQLRQLAIQETTWVDANPDNAAAFVWAVSVYQELGMTQQTEPLLTSALNIYQRTPDHPLIGQIQSQLATLYAQLQQFALAETYAQQAVTSTARAMGVSHHQVLQYLNNLGQLYQQQGEKAEARACYERTVSICERTGRQQHQHCRDARTWWKQCQD